MSDEYREGMDKLAAMYVVSFQNKPEETLKMFCNTQVPLEIMNSVYGYLVEENDIQKIETLPVELKTKLWNQAKETCPTADNKKAIKLCKCIWLINFILEK